MGTQRAGSGEVSEQEIERTDRDVIRDLEIRLGAVETKLRRSEALLADAVDARQDAEERATTAEALAAEATRTRDALADELCDISGEIVPLRRTVAKLEPIAADAEERVAAVRRAADERVAVVEAKRRSAVAQAERLRRELAAASGPGGTPDGMVTNDRLRDRVRTLEIQLRNANARNGDLAQRAERSEKDRSRARALVEANEGLVRERVNLQIRVLELGGEIAGE